MDNEKKPNLLNRFSYWLGSIFTKIGRKLQGIK